MISILFPTRHRPEAMERMVASARAFSTTEPQLIAYVDQDDLESVLKAVALGVRFVVGPRIVLSDTWNKCAAIATGDILMMASDDIIFRTPRWDEMVEKAFAEVPDRILMVYGTDLDPRFGSHFGTHPLIHRTWVETLGYFSPPGFSWGSSDTWLNDIAKFIGRRRFLPFITEHLHHSLNKSTLDDTYREGLERLKRDDVATQYGLCFPQRLADVEKLMAKMVQAVA